MAARRPALTYVLPLKAALPRHELGGYLVGISAVAQVVVVDGSPPAVFCAHARMWSRGIEHVGVDPDLTYLSGKVNGVLTGLRRAAHEAVVIADDDVRYTPAQLTHVAHLLHGADVIVPQNYFAPLPWHARWDTARTLINRAFGSDYPGTLGIRRSMLESTGGYDGDVLFENLELMRTVRAAGGRVVSVPDLFVRREPPTPRHFWGQRIRQAYDSLAQPPRLLVELAIVPLAAMASRGGLPGLFAAGGVAVAVAEAGRRRAGGRLYFPASVVLFTPAWVIERGVCSWLALESRLLRGGVHYAGGLIRRAANPQRVLRSRHG